MVRRYPLPTHLTGVLGLCALALAWGVPVAARAGVVVSQIGQEHFAAGTSPLPDAKIRAAGQGQQSPFNGVVFGDDRTKGALGAFSYSHSFDLHGGSVDCAFITMGLIDIDATRKSPSTIRVFFDGKAQPLAPFTGISHKGNSSYDVVTVPVPKDFLKDGKLDIQVQAIHAAPGFAGNAIGIDFSKLIVMTDSIGNPNNAGGPTDNGGGDGNGGGGGGGGGNGGNVTPPSVPLPAGALPAAWMMIAIAGSKLLRRRKRYYLAS